MYQHTGLCSPYSNTINTTPSLRNQISLQPAQVFPPEHRKHLNELLPPREINVLTLSLSGTLADIT